MGWQTIVVQILRAGNTIINAVGDFIYSGVPAAGNLAASIVPGTTTVTDPEGNTAQPGITSYASANVWAQLKAGVLSFQSAAGQPVLATVTSSAAGAVTMSSGSVSVSDAIAQILIESKQANDNVNRLIQMIAEQVILPVTINNATLAAPNCTALNLDICTIDLKNGNLNLNMADPPNTAAVIAGTATQAQYNACLGGMLNSMKNRQMFA